MKDCQSRRSDSGPALQRSPGPAQPLPAPRAAPWRRGIQIFGVGAPARKGDLPGNVRGQVRRALGQQHHGLTRSTMGTSTAACGRLALHEFLSSTISGVHSGGVAKRWRNACRRLRAAVARRANLSTTHQRHGARIERAATTARNHRRRRPGAGWVTLRHKKTATGLAHCSGFAGRLCICAVNYAAATGAALRAGSFSLIRADLPLRSRR